MRSNFRQVQYRYLLDTNILSDLVKHPMGTIFTKIKSVGEDEICTSIIVACELRFGAEKSGSSRIKERVESKHSGQRQKPGFWQIAR